MKYHYTLIGLLLLAFASPAQRDSRFLADHTEIGGTVSRTGMLTYENIVTELEVSIQTSVTLPGDIHGFALTTGGYGNMLITGKNAQGLGVIEHWKENATTGVYSLSSSTTFLTDITGITYSGGNLYALELSTKLIWKKAWNGTAGLGTGSWAAWLTSLQLPELSQAEEGDLDSSPTIVGEIWYSTSYLHSYFGTDDVKYVVQDQAVPSVQTVEYLTRTVGLKFGGASEGSTTVLALAAEGVTVEVVDMATSAVIGSAVGPPQTSDDPDLMIPTTITTTTPLVIGAQYLLRKAGDPIESHHAFTCVRRYGKGETFPDGTYFSAIPRSGQVYTGSPGVGQAVQLYRPTEPAAPLLFSGYMAVGVRTNGIDPVVPYGVGEFLLVTDWFLPVSGFVDTHAWGLSFGDFEVPDDPSLVGQIYLSQFWLGDSQGNVRVSQIIGQVIEGPPVQAAASSSTPLDRRLFKDARVKRIPGASQSMLNRRRK